MKASKSRKAKAQKEAAKRAAGKPPLSRYAAKRGVVVDQKPERRDDA